MHNFPTARVFIVPLFLFGLSWAYQSTLPPVGPVLITEEGQSVVFDRFTWQARELTKKLPLSERWPTGADMRTVLKTYGLDATTPPNAIPVPARIAGDVYLIGQDHVSNLTYMLDCGREGVAIIDPTYASGIRANHRKRREVRTQAGRHPLGAEYTLPRRSCHG